MQDNPPFKKNKAFPDKGDKQSAKKIPKRITESYLHNAGLYYLQRFASSSANFKRVMMRKVKKSCLHHTDQDFETCRAMVDALTQNFIRAGLLNDDVYAKGKISALRNKGKSSRAIKVTMTVKGIENAQTEHILKEHDITHFSSEGRAEFEAALVYARKKKLGPYRTAPVIDDKKELGKMARAGFSFEIAKQVLNISGEDV